MAIAGSSRLALHSGAAGGIGVQSRHMIRMPSGSAQRPKDVDLEHSVPTPCTASTTAGSTYKRSISRDSSSAMSRGVKTGTMEQLHVAIEEALSRPQPQQRKSVPGPGQQGSEDASLVFMQALDRKVDSLVSELRAQAARLAKLEVRGALASESPCSDPSSPAGARMRQPFEAQDFVKLLSDQQQEISSLKVQVAQLQDRLEAAQPETTRTLEVQLRELVTELRKLQDEQQTSQDAQKNNDIVIAESTLKELTDERSQVATMLDNVRQEKLDVIAMMHSFAIGKDEAIQELEAVRQNAAEELRTEAQRAAISCAAAVGVKRQQSAQLPASCHAHVEDLAGEAAQQARAVTLHSRQQSYPRMVSAQQQPQQPPPQQQQAHAHVGFAAAVASAQHMHQPHQGVGSMTSSVTIPAWGQTMSADTARGLQSTATSAVLIATTAAPVPPVVSPMLQTRGTAADLRGSSPGAPDVKRPGVRRFISAGMSPRVGDVPRFVISQKGA